MANLADYQEEDDPITGAIKKSIAKPEEGMKSAMGALEGGMLGNALGASAEDVPSSTIAPFAAPPTSPLEVDGKPVSEAPEKPDYRKLGKYAGQMGAWSTDAANPSEKFGRGWDDMSERYKMLTVLSNFDPTKGLNQEGLIEALNAADINGAQFSAAGDDKLDARNLSKWRNFDGREGIGDIITGFKTGKGTWGGWSPEGGEGGPEVQAEMPGGGPVAQNTTDPLTEKLNTMVPTDDDFFQQLMKQAQEAAGGQMDRKALLSLMG
jgi:hypothetical protein